jgi:hypothetical protein
VFLGTTDMLQLTTDAGTDVVFSAAAYEDNGTALTYVPNAGQSNGTAPVAIIAAPASGNRVIKNVSLRNGASVARVVTIALDVSGTDRVLLVATLQSGDRITYTEELGWVVVSCSDANTSVSAYPLSFVKAGTAAEAAASWYSMLKDAGLPGAFVPGTPGLAGRVINGTSEGGIPRFVNPTVGTMHLQKFVAASSTVHTLQLYDLLWINSGIVVTTTTAQTINSVAFPARDQLGQVNGRGCLVGILVTAATTNGAAIANSVLSYTNSDGVPGRTATLVAVAGSQFPATAVVGTVVWFRLDAGDDGVQSIQSITLNTSLVTGSISLILARPIDQAFAVAANVPAVGVSTEGAGRGPRLFNDTALWLAYIASATTATQVQASLQLEEWA